MHRGAAAVVILLLAGCAAAPPPPGGYRVKGQTYVPLARADGFTETGLASWYGPGFHGRRTSSGETYDMHARTAAHKLLPLGTTVRVTRLDDGRQVTARINDRGPFVKGRVIDLSYALARELGMLREGVVRVRVEALSGPRGMPAPPPGLMGPFAWQVGAFAVAANAEDLARALGRSYAEVTVEPYDRGDAVLQRVWVGRYDSPDQAQRDGARLSDRGLQPILVRRD
ncbi:MAG: septal ring lytic transglycosylase RlpA family protein [Deferrisomatales bacterium]